MNNNYKLFKSRYRQIVAIVLILMTILAVRLFVVTVVKHDEWSDKASEQNTKILYTSAPRGNIYDRYGRPLAVSKQIFTVNFNVSSLDTEEINDAAYKLVNVLIDNNEKFNDNFGIKIDKNGDFYYTYDSEVKKWLHDQGMDPDLSPEQAFTQLRTKYRIDPGLDRYEAMDILRDKYSLDPPISVKKMVYTHEEEKERFLTKFGYPASAIEKGISAEQCFKDLRKQYNIDKSMSDEEARKIFVIRNEIATNGFTRYRPIKVATNLKPETIAYLEEAAIPGVEIASETQRSYPGGSEACHVLGYMGAISESEAEYYVKEQGYSATDLVGKDGLEAAMEEHLHGKAGHKEIRVNSGGEYVETLKEEKPEKGNDVFASIDADLQKAMEESLEKNIKKSENSQSGAVVAIDIETGQVLGMASYPEYDPNIFANGISNEAWESVQPDNPRDSMSPSPLWNNVTRTAVAPGSTFKPITSITALECGLDPYRQIYDKGYVNIGGRNFGCDLWNNYGGSHGSINLEWGLGESCNYYFYCIAAGKDFGTGASLGYKEPITVEKIVENAREFGLGEETGIELYETVRPSPSAEGKQAAMEASVRSFLYENAHTFFPSEIADDYEKLKKNLYVMSDWMKDNPDFNDLIKMVDEETDVIDSQVENVATRLKFDYFIQADWGMGDLFNTSIGQGFHSYTPLQVANYIATIGNRGVRNKVTLLSGVEGRGEQQTEVAKKIDLDQNNLDEVIKGMKRVCKSGTLANTYRGFPIEVAGKTGTAENQSIKQPKSEVDYIRNHLGAFNGSAGTGVSFDEVYNKAKEMVDKDKETYPTVDDAIDDALIELSDYKINQSMINSYKDGYEEYAWTVSMAPADNPKVAVVAMLVEGGYSYNAAPIVRDVMDEYFKLNEKAEKAKEEKKKSEAAFSANNGKNVIQ